MKKIFAVLAITTGILMISLFQNCSKVSVREVGANENQSVSPLGQEGFIATGNEDIDEHIKNCAEARSKGQLSLKKANVVFDDPGRVCDWGLNGNLTESNSYIRARTEQSQSIAIPAGVKVCNIQMKNTVAQQFRYDDNIIMTVNDYIIASTSNFSKHLTQKNGYYRYEWSKLINKAAQNAAYDTTLNKQYCAGASQGYSTCEFPVTETLGTVRLDFDQRVIQSILGLSDPSAVKLGVITTGDNDSTDCQHVPVHLDVQIEYY